MKIGIISADKHCKSHIAALRKDGYNVTCLGARPTSIPTSYDALIVRVASISHGGEATARAWAKQTGKPAIYEDGLSGIRRELSALLATGEGVEEDPSPPDIFAKLLGCAESYREARPDDGPDEMAKALRGVIFTEHPDLSERLRRSMVPSIIARFFPTTSTATPEKTMPNIALPSYAGSPALWPTDTGWAKVYAEPKVRNSYDEAVEIITAANHLTITSFTNSVKAGVFSRKVKNRWESLLRGKPLTAAFVMFMLLPDLTKQEEMQAYRLITDKGMDSRLKDVVEWALGIAEAVVPTEAVVPAKTAAPEAVPHGGDTVESNTEAILTLMEEVAELRKGMSRETPKAFSPVVDALDARIKALEEGNGPVGSEWEARIEGQIKDLDERVVQVRLDQIPDSDMWSRIKALERCWDDLKGQVPTLIDQAAGEVEHRLRSDISNAFDALAAEAQAASNPASNPLAALEEVKAALKAAGFKGTLTLTIE